MSPDLIEDHNLLLFQMIARFSAKRGFIVLRNPATGSPSEFIATYNFDMDRYVKALGHEDDGKRSVQDEYDNLRLILFDLMAQDQPVLTHNITNRFLGSIPAWPVCCVMAIPLKQDGQMYGLLWCDRRFLPWLWKEEDLMQAIAFVNQFFSASAV